MLPISVPNSATLSNLQKALNNIQLQVQALHEGQQQILSLLTRTLPVGTDADQDNILPERPFKTQEEFADFDSKLDDKTTFMKVVRIRLLNTLIYIY